MYIYIYIYIYTHKHIHPIHVYRSARLLAEGVLEDALGLLQAADLHVARGLSVGVTIISSMLTLTTTTTNNNTNKQ